VSVAETEASEGEAPPARIYNPWLIVALLMALSTVSYLDRSIIFLVVDQIRADLHLSDVDLGVLQGLAFGLFYAAFGLPAGWLVDRFPRQRVLAIAFAFWTLATTACGLARNFFQFFLGRFGVGAGEAALNPAAYSILGDLFKKRQLAFAISVYASGSNVGSALALTLGGLVVARATAHGAITLPIVGLVQPWQQAFLLTSLPTLPLVAILLFMSDPGRRNQNTKDQASWGELFAFLRKNRINVGCHFLGFGLLAILAYGTGAWGPTFYMRHFGAPVATVGLWLGIVNMAMGLPGLFFAGLTVDWLFGRGYKDAHFRYFMFAAPLLAVVAMIGFYWAPSPIVSLFCQGVTLFLVAFGGIAPAHLQIITPVRLRGRVSAFYVFTFSMFGLALGPLMMAVVNERLFHDPASIGKAMGLCYLVICPLVAALFAFNLRHATRSVEAAGG
jgi:MFS family permease